MQPLTKLLHLCRERNHAINWSYFGEVDFAEKWSLMGIKYGLFIQSIIDFIIVAFALFIFIKIANTVMRKGEEEEEIDEQTVLLTEIRDALREK